MTAIDNRSGPHADHARGAKTFRILARSSRNRDRLSGSAF
jgi:hypothetical protein